MTFSGEYFSKDYFFGMKHSNYRNYNHYDTDLYWKSIISIIKKYHLNGKILDVGCAFGFLLKRVKPYFDEVHGLDISPFAIQRAQKEAPFGRFKIINIGIEELPYPDEYFDFITALDVLEHTESIEKTLRKIVHKLRAHGYLLIEVPIIDTWAGKIFHALDRDSSHIGILPRRELLSTIQHMGLEMVEKGYILNTPFMKLKGLPIEIQILMKKY